MRQWPCAILLMLLAAADVAVAARSVLSYRSRTYRSSSYSYTYRGPVYTRRLSPTVMGALYFSYASRYPNYFSYRRAATVGGSTCLNNLALDNSSYIGNFSCPFLPDEPGNWTKCCGYEVEGFCCDPSYDDSWKYDRLSGLTIGLIVVGCLVGVAVLAWAAVSVVRKRALLAQGTAAVVGNGNAARAQSYGSAEDSAMKQPLPYPTPAFEHGQGLTPSAPPYPPPYYGTHENGAAEPR